MLKVCPVDGKRESVGAGGGVVGGINGLRHNVRGDGFGLEMGWDLAKPVTNEAAHLRKGGKGVVFFTNFLVMFDYYVAHFLGVLGKLVMNTGA
jgi:hypothetical protein